MSKRKQTRLWRSLVTLFGVGGLLVWAKIQQLFTKNPLLGATIVGLIVDGLIVTVFGLFYWKYQQRQRLMGRNTLRALSPLEFEKAVAEIFRRLGYKARLTPRTNDKGIDIWVSSPNGEKFAVQCKQYHRAINSKEIREFIGALASAQQKVMGGFFVTTSYFSKAARQTAKQSPIPLRLIDGETLGSWYVTARRQPSSFLPWVWWQRLSRQQKIFLFILLFITIWALTTAITLLFYTI